MKAEDESEKDEKVYWLDDPANVKRVIRWFFVACAVVASLDVVLWWERRQHPDEVHEHFWIEGTPFFYCWYGLGACVLLVLVAKQLRKVLMRDEDYYDH
jgi:hypothetical protein